MTKSANTIRKEFIEFFEAKAHRFVPSAPVVPQDDPTLLFTNAGMNQFKPIFLGEERDNLKRAVNSQKCMRVSGKHNDLEEVGVDHHHHTLFEMLGNWSFGDYYKKEAIQWAWELLTTKWKLPKDKLYATVYRDDKESEELWKSVTDINHSNISRHDEKDNFWEMGDTGPCGPCSEIHLDSGENTCIHENNPEHTCGVNAPGCGRYIEIWNLVFIQFNRQKDGSLIDLPRKHVDTGMGFERLVRVMQGVTSNYDTDLFTPILKEIENISGKSYTSGSEGVPMRVIADHLRALLFAITDGALPSNEGRGYVLRRLLRRAYRFGRSLGFVSPFIYKLVPIVVDMMKDAFPELVERKDFVMQIIKSEEERFDQTLQQGLDKINTLIDHATKQKKTELAGKDVFTLYDTFGFPMDLTRLIALEQGMAIDEVGFHEHMQKQKDLARKASGSESSQGLTPEGWVEVQQVSQTEFVGYDTYETDVIVCKYKVIESQNKKSDVTNILIILDKTPFYAEMGGQVGDQGTLQAKSGELFTIVNTIKWNDMTIHKATLSSPFSKNLFTKPLLASINENRRLNIQRNHTATHLLQSALRSVVGDHITQSGSWVGPDSLRFDFTHFEALSQDELKKIEEQLNRWILSNFTVNIEMKSIKQAKEEGALAIFGEKYGETVRVVSIGNISKEFCGGAHCKRTGDIGLFYITSESSIAAGTRRIEAVTGLNSLMVLRQKAATIDNLCGTLKIPENKLFDRVNNQIETIKKLESEITALSQNQAVGRIETMLEKANSQGKFPWVAVNIGVVDKATFTTFFDTLSDTIKEKQLDSTVVFFAAQVGEKALFASCSGKKAVSEFSIHSGDLVKKAAQVAGGGGGGSPFRAQAGGKNVAAIEKAVESAVTMIKEKAGVA